MFSALIGSFHSFHVTSELQTCPPGRQKLYCRPLPCSHPLNIFEYNLARMPDSCCDIRSAFIYSCQKSIGYGTNMWTLLFKPWLTGQITTIPASPPWPMLPGQNMDHKSPNLWFLSISLFFLHGQVIQVALDWDKLKKTTTLLSCRTNDSPLFAFILEHCFARQGSDWVMWLKTMDR